MDSFFIILILSINLVYKSSMYNIYANQPQYTLILQDYDYNARPLQPLNNRLVQLNYYGVGP